MCVHPDSKLRVFGKSLRLGRIFRTEDGRRMYFMQGARGPLT